MKFPTKVSSDEVSINELFLIWLINQGIQVSQQSMLATSAKHVPMCHGAPGALIFCFVYRASMTTLQKVCNVLLHLS